MAKRKAPSTNLEEEAVQRIFTALLMEFKEKNFGAQELHDGYRGLSPTALKNICLQDGQISQVDFDLALKDMEQDNLINTGPLAAVDNPPESSVVIIGLFSKRDYAYLSEDGYKAATRVKPARVTSPQHIHISGNFHQSPIGVGAHVSQTINLSVGTAAMFQRLREEIETSIQDGQKRSEALISLNALEVAQDKPSKIERYTQLMGILGDHITVLSFLLTPLFQRLMQ